MTSIMLEEVASTSITAQSRPILLIIAAVLAFIGLTQLDTSKAIATGTLVSAGLLGLVYLLTRRATLSIASAGASIDLAVTDSSDKVFRNFIDSLESAKNQRFLDGSARR